MTATTTHHAARKPLTVIVHCCVELLRQRRRMRSRRRMQQSSARLLARHRHFHHGRRGKPPTSIGAPIRRLQAPPRRSAAARSSSLRLSPLAACNLSPYGSAGRWRRELEEEKDSSPRVFGACFVGRLYVVGFHSCRRLQCDPHRSSVSDKRTLRQGESLSLSLSPSLLSPFSFERC